MHVHYSQKQLEDCSTICSWQSHCIDVVLLLFGAKGKERGANPYLQPVAELPKVCRSERDQVERPLS